MSVSSWIAAIGLLLAAASCGGQSDPVVDSADGGEPGDVTFIDRFGYLDEERWMVSDGWSNGDWTANLFVAEQVSAGDRGLTMTLDLAEEGGEKPYVGAEIRTVGERFHHGYYEIDMKAPRGDGIVSGFFTYTGSFFGDPHDEIDIEILGRNTREVSFTIFDDGEPKTTEVRLGFDAADDFHLYGFEWTPDYIRWYVDGELMHEETGEDFPLPQTPQIYYLNLWASETLTDWVGHIDPREAPWTLSVRCMAHAKSYTGRTLCR